MRSLGLNLTCAVVISAGALAAIPASAQDAPLWVREIGSAGNERWSGVTTDPASNDITAVGDAGGPINGQPYLGRLDCLIARYGSGGSLRWTRTFGTSGVDKCFGAATDGLHNVIASGYTEGDLGGPGHGLPDPIVAKYTAQGVQVWINHELGSPAEDLSTAAATDRQSNVFATGWAEGPVHGSATHHGGRDAWVAKWSPDGHLLWVTQIGTDELDAAYGVATDSNGDVYVGGTTRGSLYGPVQDSDGGYVYGDAFVAKFSGATGALIWGKQFGSNLAEVVYGTAVDRNDNVIVAGRADGPLFVNPRLGDQDLFVAKFNTNGNLLWGRQFGTPASDNGTGIAVDLANNVLVGGHTTGSLAAPYTGVGRDFVVRKYDPNGNLIGTRQIGTPTAEFEWDIATDNRNKIILVGQTQDSFAGQPYAGGTDAVIVQYGPNLQ